MVGTKPTRCAPAWDRAAFKLAIVRQTPATVVGISLTESGRWNR